MKATKFGVVVALLAFTGVAIAQDAPKKEPSTAPSKPTKMIDAPAPTPANKGEANKQNAKPADNL